MMMFDFNPWSSLFLLHATRMYKPPRETSKSRRRREIAQLNEQRPTAAEPVVRSAKVPPPLRVRQPAPWRGWRHAFRTGRVVAERTTDETQNELAT